MKCPLCGHGELLDLERFRDFEYDEREHDEEVVDNDDD